MFNGENMLPHRQVGLCAVCGDDEGPWGADERVGALWLCESCIAKTEGLNDIDLWALIPENRYYVFKSSFLEELWRQFGDLSEAFRFFHMVEDVRKMWKNKK